jgi:hypothetical protein
MIVKSEYGSRRFRAALVGASFGVLLGACASNHPPADTVRLDADEASEIDRFLPLEDGVVATYVTESSSGEGLMTMQVKRTAHGLVEMRFAGRDESLRTGTDGVHFLDGGYLLKTPLVRDNSWEGQYGFVRITDTDAEADVPAGRFKGCVRTEERERNSRTARTITSVFCPHVGMVSMKIEGKGTRESAVLKGLGPRVDPMASDIVARAEP